MKLVFFLAVFILSFSNTASAQSGNTIFDRSYIHEIKVYFSDAAFWDTLELHYSAYFNGGALDEANKQYLLADSVIVDGVLLDSVGVRQKGYSSNVFVNGPRKPLKIDFKEFKNQKYEGLKKLNLSNSYSDKTLLRDMICYEFYRNLGIPSPRVSFTKVYLNDQYWGLYNCIEQIDSEFLEDHFNLADGDLYKPINSNSLQWHGSDWTQYQDTFRIRTNEESSNHSDFFNFLDEINTTPDINFEATLNNVLNVEQYLNFLSAEVLVNNNDGHHYYNRNNYFYFDLETGKVHFLPWDHNFSLSSTSNISIITDYPALDPNLFAKENVLITRVQANPSLRDQYFNSMCFALDKFSLDKMEPLIDSMVLLTKATVLSDPYLVIQPWNIYDENIYNQGITSLKAVFDQRVTEIMTEFGQYGYSCSLETEDLTKESLSIYPNPTESLITVKTNGSIESITLYDVLGNRIFETISKTLSLEELAVGQYIIEVRTNNGIIQERVVKQ